MSPNRNLVLSIVKYVVSFIAGLGTIPGLEQLLNVL